MSFRSQLAKLFQRAVSPTRVKRVTRCRPTLETLEDRVVPAAATLSHLYDLNDSLADAFGGPALLADGGTLNATNYSFNNNQGLRLINGLADTSNYSVAMKMTIFNTTFYKKILD